MTKDEAFSDVEDITEVLEVTVFDENRRTKHDFLGKVKLTFVYCTTYNVVVVVVAVVLILTWRW